MARKTEKEAVKQTEEPTTATSAEVVASGETSPTADEKTEETVQVSEGNVIEPVAVAIRLNTAHPQASYGRCGYRFFKDKDVEIPMSELDGDLIWVLENDPYLQLTFITEE